MKKKLISTVIAASLVATSLTVTLPPKVEAAAQTAEITYGVNFRTSPSTAGNKIRMLKRGEDITILDKVNSYWYKVRDNNGKVGYISTADKYTKITGSVDSGKVESGSKGEAIGKVTWGVSFRTGPSTSYKRLRYLQKGETVTILEEVNSYWYKVRDKNGVVGYASSNSKYFDVSGKPGSSSGSKDQSVPSNYAQKVIAAGKKYLGTPYEFGSNRNSTVTFDCSDFVRRAFIDGAGITLPMDSRQQAEYVKKNGTTTTNWRNLEPGDLLFFMDYKGTKKSNYSGINKSKQRISHVSIYLGNGKVLHTYSKKSGGVRIDTIAGKHWEYRFVFGGSVK